MTRIIWQCNYCSDIAISYSNLKHEMNWCDCKKSGIDLEEEYCRGVGDVKTLSVKESIDGKWVKVDG